MRDYFIMFVLTAVIGCLSLSNVRLRFENDKLTTFIKEADERAKDRWAFLKKTYADNIKLKNKINGNKRSLKAIQRDYKQYRLISSSLATKK